MKVFLRAASLLVLLPAVSAAQAGRIEDRLPPDTSLLIAWRGGTVLESNRATNPLLRFWNDPEFAPAREELLAQLLKSASREGLPDFSREDIDRLVEIPFAVGLIGPLDLSAPGAKPARLGVFIIGNITGKEDLIRRLDESARKNRKKDVVSSQLTLSGVSVEVFTGPKDVDYVGTVGPWRFSTTSKETAEALIPRLQSSAPPAASLAHTELWKEATANRDAGTALEFFWRLPDFSKVAVPPTPALDGAALLKSLHFERLRALTASLSLAGTTTRYRSSFLGDTSPGSLLDVFGANGAEFVTQAAAPPGALSFNAVRLDLKSFYATIHAALLGAMSPEDRPKLEMGEGFLGTQIGMSLPEAMNLLSGEAAMISTETTTDPLENLYAISIQKPEDVLRALRASLGKTITAEDNLGSTTLLTLGLAYTDEKTRAQRKRFVTLAVTPTMVLIASRKTTVKEAVARVAASPGPPAREPRVGEARSRFPKELMVFGYADYSRLDWAKLKASAIESARKQEQARKEAAEKAGKNYEPGFSFADWLEKVPVSLLTRYFHFTAGGGWKSPRGIYLDGYLE